MFKFQFRSRQFWYECPTIHSLFLLCWFKQLEVMAPDTAWVVDGTAKSTSAPEERAMPPQVPQRLLWWLTHAFPPRKWRRSTQAKLPGASLHSRAMQGSALRVGPVDVLQTDVRPLPQLILPENNTTLLDEHRDLIIRVPGLSSLLSVCNVTSCGIKKAAQDMAIYPQAVMPWCSCWIYTWLDHCTLWSAQNGLADPHRASSKLFLILCQRLKDEQYMVWHEAGLLIWHKACCHKIIPFTFF